MTTNMDRGIADRTRLCMRLMCLAVAGIGMHAEVLVAAPGDLDPGFGDHGRVRLPFDGGLDYYVEAAGPAIVRQADGRVLVARADKGISGWESEVAVARLRTDGTLDPEFGTDGVVRLRFRGDEAAGVSGLALLPDGRLLVVGYSVTSWLEDGGMGPVPNLDTGLALLRTDGSLDPDGFGSGGRVALDLSKAGLADYAAAAVALADGGIVVAGTAEGGSGARFFMLRMTAQGDLDPSFGERDGLAWADSINVLRGFHRSASGQFVACGNGWAGPDPGGRIARFDSAGSLLGETNLLSLDIEYLTACALQQDGSVVVGGIGLDGAWLGRVGVDGRLDSAFGDRAGRTLIECSICTTWDRFGYSHNPTDVAVLADGRLAVALHGNGWGQLAVLRYAPDGRPDTGSAPAPADRFYDTGWGELPPTAGDSQLLQTLEGDQFAVIAGGQGTTVIRLKSSGGPGASVIGLQGEFTQQSEADDRGLLVCRSGSSEGRVTVNFATRDDTAQSPDDYVPASGLLAWDDGETGCKAISITVNVDGRSEPVESIWVDLTEPVGAGLAMDKARLHIIDAASPGPAPGPTPGGNSNKDGGGAAGSALFLMLGALACCRRFNGMFAARSGSASASRSRTPITG